jgi:hypothetical protein
MKKLVVLVTFLVLSTSHALAQSHTPRLLSDGDRYSITTYGGGGLYGGYFGVPGVGPDRVEAGAVGLSSSFGRHALYGQGTLRLSIGNATGLVFSNIGGYNLMSWATGDSNFPLIIGVEPLNIEFSAVSSIDGPFPRNYITWMPSGALGFNIPLTSVCRVAVVARGGAYGTTATGLWGGAYGLGGYINCDNAVDFAAELHRLHDETHPVDVVTTEIQLPVIPSGPTGDGRVSVGLRAEYLNIHEGGANFLIELPRNNERPEMRAFLLVTMRERL